MKRRGGGEMTGEKRGRMCEGDDEDDKKREKRE